MFANKLQNPFLKPSPFASGSSGTPSYSSSSSYPFSREQSYKPYEEPRSSYAPSGNQYSSYDKPYNAKSYKSFESKDIDSILSNNPFSRDQPTFGYSQASRDLSPSRVGNDPYAIPSSYNSYQNYGGASRDYETSRQVAGRYTEPTRGLTPPKKYDNYLSTSSAQSATTYINKIHDLDDDRSLHEHGKPLSNPFLRKNLLKSSSNQIQIPNSGYDYLAMKHMNYRIKEERELSPYNEINNYQQDYRPSSKIESNFNRGMSFGNNVEQDYGKKYEQEFSNAYIDDYKSKPSLDRIPGLDDVYGTFGGLEPKDNYYEDKPFDSKKYQKDSYKSPHYDIDNYEPKFGSNYDNSYKGDNKDYLKPDSYTNIENKYDNYGQDDYNNDWKAKEESYKMPSYEGFQDGYPRSSKKIQDRQRYEDKPIVFEQSQRQSSRHQSYKDIPGNFETLGGRPNPYSSKQIDRYDEYDSRGPNKLASSNVDEYNNAEDMQKKIKNSKYSKLGLQKEYDPDKPRSSSKIVTFNDHQEDLEQNQRSRGPNRDGGNHPGVLQINGVLFHKIEVM